MDATDIAKLCASLSISDVDGHGLRDCPDEEARLGALEGESTTYGSWLRASTVEQSKARTPKNDSNGSGNASHLNPLENQTERNSGSDKISGHNSNESVSPQKTTLQLVPTQTGRQEFELGIGIGPPTDAVARVFSMNVNQGEGHNLQLSTYSKVAQIDGFPENDEGKDMEIVIVDNLSSLATESQPEVPESHGDSSKVVIRKWKRIARAKGTNLEQDPSGDLNPVQSSLYAASPVLGDEVLTGRRDPGLMISEHPFTVN
ncbi:hypothetical protein Q3G72_020578 [Acer saccharum]|nr:hypothetical protein Q3G72_020578 [Acer saccharum]